MRGGQTAEAQSTQTLFGLFLSVAGIYAAYLYYGILQERLTNTVYEGERYTFVRFQIFAQCVFGALFARVLAFFMPSSATPMESWRYFLLASTYLGGMISSYVSFGFITYPMVTIAKATKMLPVMVVGTLVNRTRYPLIEYVCMFFVSLGISLFFIFKAAAGAGKAIDDVSNADAAIGLGLCLLSLTFDGLTSAIQDRVVGRFNVQSHELMLNMNGASMVILLPYLLISGEMQEALDFLYLRPDAVMDLAFFAIVSAFGQLVIFWQIVAFGALACSITTTTRKFFSIVASVLWFGHAITPLQWLGCFLVFSALGVQLYGKWQKQRSRAKTA